MKNSPWEFFKEFKDKYDKEMEIMRKKDKLHRRPIQDPILELLQFYSERAE